MMSLTCCSGALFLFEQLMEKLNFDYSLKNILTPNNTRYNLKLIKKLGSPQNVLRSLLLSKPGRKVGTGRITYDSKLRYHSSRLFELEEFEKVPFNHSHKKQIVWKHGPS